jgi:purine nucleosidase
MVPLDVTRQAVLPRAGMRATLARAPGALAARIQGFCERGFRISHSDGERGMALHDPLAVGLALDPSLAAWEPVRLAIGPDGETLRTSGPANCRFAKRVESDRFIRLFLDRLCPPPARDASS